MALRLLACAFFLGRAGVVFVIRQRFQEQVNVVLGPLKAADGFFAGLGGVAKKVLDGLDEGFGFVAHDVFFRFQLVGEKGDFFTRWFLWVAVVPPDE